MSRKTDRRHVFNLMFQMQFYPQMSPEELFERYFSCRTFEAEDLELGDKADMEYVMTTLAGITEHSQHINRKIAEFSRNFLPERLMKTDLVILRLAVYELLYSPSVPPKVAINEAVELSKIYSGDESPAFVNGLLGQLARTHKI